MDPPRVFRVLSSPGLLSGSFACDELDFETGFRRQTFGALTNPIAKLLRKLRLIELPELPLETIRCVLPPHGRARQRNRNEHPVPATQDAFDLPGRALPPIAPTPMLYLLVPATLRTD